MNCRTGSSRRYEPSDSETEYGSEDDRHSKKPIETKQDLLHILSTEIAINNRLYGEFTCFRSTFDHWNPSLPHATVLEVLSFFGVSKKWLAFFKSFLKAPLKFIDEESSTPRTRQRGTPGSHALSDVFGEVILFCLDFSINQRTSGAPLYRIHDEFWFWSHDYATCVKAWQQVTEFTKAMGVELNESKTGTVKIVSSSDKSNKIDAKLPHGQIRWGFLYLDPETARFEIDQSMVDSHIDELRSQLQAKSKSVFGWIQAWNTYAATFFTSNFGRPANCFGREHVDKMLATHQRIQQAIFEGTQARSVVEYLKVTIQERFGVTDVPDGFFFFPVELGGLDLRSPFVGLLQIRDSIANDPSDFLERFEEKERDAYREAKSDFEKGETARLRDGCDDPHWKPSSGADDFMTFAEYTKYREEFAAEDQDYSLLEVYKDLLRRPSERGIDASYKVKQALEQLGRHQNLRGILSNWGIMECYWKWVAQLYGPEMVDRFGGLSVVDPGLLPIGMVSLFREMRISWQG